MQHKDKIDSSYSQRVREQHKDKIDQAIAKEQAKLEPKQQDGRLRLVNTLKFEICM